MAFNKLRIKRLLSLIETQKYKSELEGNYSLFNIKYIKDTIEKIMKLEDSDRIVDLLKYFYNLVMSWSKTKIDLEVGNLVESMANSEEFDYLIHRANLDLDENYSSIKLIDIMENGLINYGHANDITGSAITTIAPDLSLTTTPLNSSMLAYYGDLIKPWNENDSIVIIRLPKGLLDKDYEFKNPNDVYNYVNGEYYIKPEFVVGNIVKLNDKLIKFESKEEILAKKENKHL